MTAELDVDEMQHDSDVRVRSVNNGRQITIAVVEPKLSPPDESRVLQRLRGVPGIGSADSSGENTFVATIANEIFNPKEVALSATDAVANAVVLRDNVIVRAVSAGESGQILVITDQPHNDDSDLREAITRALGSYRWAKLVNGYNFSVKPRGPLTLEEAAALARAAIVAYYQSLVRA
jgi:hypothetical protein